MCKKIISIFIVLTILAAAIFTFSACGGADKITVSFVQEGRETRVIEIEKGGTIKNKDIIQPAKTTKYGYTVQWDRTDFSNLTEDTVVYAVEVPKVLVVWYDTDGGEPIDYSEFTFDAPYTLPVPVKAGYNFNGWLLGGEPFDKTEVWKVGDNITLKATWEQVD